MRVLLIFRDLAILKLLFFFFCLTLSLCTLNIKIKWKLFTGGGVGFGGLQPDPKYKGAKITVSVQLHIKQRPCQIQINNPEVLPKNAGVYILQN